MTTWDLVSETLHKQSPITAETTKRLQMKNLPTLCNDSSFSVQFINSVSWTKAILPFTMKIIITFAGENSRKVEWQHETWSQKLCINNLQSLRKPQSGSKWKTYRLSAMILLSQFNLAIQFRGQRQFCRLRWRLSSKRLNSTQACDRCDPLNIKLQSR